LKSPQVAADNLAPHDVLHNTHQHVESLESILTKIDANYPSLMSSKNLEVPKRLCPK